MISKQPRLLFLLSMPMAPELCFHLSGKQTPMRGHPVFIAQHATATCCRGYLKKWHRIEKGRALYNGEIGFVEEMVMGWINGQMRYILLDYLTAFGFSTQILMIKRLYNHAEEAVTIPNTRTVTR